MTEASRAVFVSYTSSDAAAAQRICDALRMAGIEVWFDQSELRGGDAWDRRIREQILACRLFMPLISAHTETRDEGYFRREWRLAVERAGDMAERKAFLVPVVIDGTSERGASVPDKFRDVQWTRLPAGEVPAAFIERIRTLLGLPATPAAAPAAPIPAPVPQRPRSSRILIAGLGALVAAVLVYFIVDRARTPKSAVPSPRIAAHAPAATASFAPPAHSIAVLPFVNMSGDKEQDYFSDGLTEELLNSLAAINELQVAARTSAFSFKGKDLDIGTIARKLNVGAVLEGSVRRSGHTIRITTQLINAVTGFHVWSNTYDRDLGDVLKLQTEIATAVASALKVSLLGDVSSKIELGGTRVPAAFDAYLRAAKIFETERDPKGILAAIDQYTEAIRLDPNYALAFAGRSGAFTGYGADAASGAEVPKFFGKAEADARKALALTPQLAQAHSALARVLEAATFDFEQARAEYAQALALAPGDAQVLRDSSWFDARMGHFDTAITAARKAVMLDPLGRATRSALARSFDSARRFREAAAVQLEVISLNPEFAAGYAERGLALYALGDLEGARAACETKPDYWEGQQCLAIVYYKLGQKARAEAVLAKMRQAMGDAASYQYATIYAQWGASELALDALETALRVRDPGLVFLKTDWFADPLRDHPRFKAVMKALKFPE